MKKVLFIDRDGTIVSETDDEMVDKIEKVRFLPEALYYLRKIHDELDYELVMVTNQDGLGTESWPEENFRPAHEFIRYSCGQTLRARKSSGQKTGYWHVNRLPEW